MIDIRLDFRRNGQKSVNLGRRIPEPYLQALVREKNDPGPEANTKAEP
jgi:hypothetical protein